MQIRDGNVFNALRCIEGSVLVEAVIETIEQRAINPEASMYDSSALLRWGPGDTDARLRQKLCAVRCKCRRADVRLRLKHSILVEDEIRSSVLRLVPAIRRFNAEAKPQFKIWPKA